MLLVKINKNFAMKALLGFLLIFCVLQIIAKQTKTCLKTGQVCQSSVRMLSQCLEFRNFPGSTACGYPCNGISGCKRSLKSHTRCLIWTCKPADVGSTTPKPTPKTSKLGKMDATLFDGEVREKLEMDNNGGKDANSTLERKYPHKVKKPDHNMDANEEGKLAPKKEKRNKTKAEGKQYMHGKKKQNGKTAKGDSTFIRSNASRIGSQKKKKPSQRTRQKKKKAVIEANPSKSESERNAWLGSKISTLNSSGSQVRFESRKQSLSKKKTLANAITSQEQSKNITTLKFKPEVVAQFTHFNQRNKKKLFVGTELSNNSELPRSHLLNESLNNTRNCSCNHRSSLENLREKMVGLQIASAEKTVNRAKHPVLVNNFEGKPEYFKEELLSESSEEQIASQQRIRDEMNHFLIFQVQKLVEMNRVQARLGEKREKLGRKKESFKFKQNEAKKKAAVVKMMDYFLMVVCIVSAFLVGYAFLEIYKDFRFDFDQEDGKN